ncbi:MAG: peptide chain release factor N(5)-glutamine methyltransferase [Planctomycetaceae bacterium]|jgi:release factor glutamine methyltransferase|nr:peptide chain release factor N(5)-glutamine methyltransferase [Planctomycetaceae bacterium]
MPELWTVKRLLEWTTDFFKKKNFDTPRLEAEILLAAAMNVKRIALYTAYDSEPADAQRTVFRGFVKRRGAGEPAAYLVGYREFYSLPFKVDKRVLIPRPETESLVLEGIDYLKTLPEGTTPSVIDIGTGSGAVAVSLAKNLPKKSNNAKITAVDISADALTVAKENAAKNGVADKIEFVQSDLLTNVNGTFDLILSNPPYVSKAQYDALPVDVKNYEPQLALLSGETGTEVIERIIVQAKEKLNSGGALFIEGSPFLLPAVEKMLNNWHNVRIINDNAGLNRIITATR